MPPPRCVHAAAVPEFRRTLLLIAHQRQTQNHKRVDGGQAMKAVDGMSLKAVLAESGPLAPEVALAVLKGLLLALPPRTTSGSSTATTSPPT